MSDVGALLGRFQPPSKGHEKTVNYIKAREDECYVGIYDLPFDEDNFLTYEERVEAFRSYDPDLDFFPVNGPIHFSLDLETGIENFESFQKDLENNLPQSASIYTADFRRYVEFDLLKKLGFMDNFEIKLKPKEGAIGKDIRKSFYGRKEEWKDMVNDPTEELMKGLKDEVEERTSKEVGWERRFFKSIL